MQRNKVKGNRPLYRLVTDNSSFASNEDETIIVSPRPSIVPSSQVDQLVDDNGIQDQQPQTSGNRKKKEGKIFLRDFWGARVFLHFSFPVCSE